MDKCLYLVSSSATREYVADCVEALALPRGAVMHFRYLHDYIDSSLRSLGTETEECANGLKDLPVVVVYLHQTQRGGEWRPEGEYLPLRCGFLRNAFTDGKVAHFYFEVGDYVKTLIGDEPPRQLLKSKVTFKTAHKDKKDKEVPSFAHLGEELRLNAPEDETSRAFQDFVLSTRQNEWRTRSLGSTPLDVTYDVVFYRIAGLYEEQSGGLSLVAPKLRSIQGTRSFEYEIQSGATYHLKLITQLPFRSPAQLPGQGEAKLRLIFDPAIITPVGPTALTISSPYDLEYWSWIAEVSAPRHSVLRIVCQHDMRPTKEERREFLRKEFLCPELVLPISVIPELPDRRAVQEVR
jgi:hypothetical protein